MLKLLGGINFKEVKVGEVIAMASGEDWCIYQKVNKKEVLFLAESMSSYNSDCLYNGYPITYFRIGETFDTPDRYYYKLSESTQQLWKTE